MDLEGEGSDEEILHRKQNGKVVDDLINTEENFLEQQQKMKELENQVFQLQRQLEAEKARAREEAKKKSEEGLRKRKNSQEDEDSVGIRGKEIRVPLSANYLDKFPRNPPKQKKNSSCFGFELSNFIVAVKYVITDTKRHKRAWWIGFFTVFLVVAFVSLLQNAIDRSPLIFLKLGEDQVGEYDLLLTPMFSATEFSFWLNFTELEPKIASAPLAKGSTPRWAVLGKVINPKDQTSFTSTIILIIDQDREEQIDLGREWKSPRLGKDEAHVSSSVLRTLGLEANNGDTIILELDFFGLLQTLGITGGESPEAFLANIIDQTLSQNLNGVDLTNVTVGELIETIEQLLGPINVDVAGIIGQIFGDDNISNELTLDLNSFLEQFLANIRETLTIRREYLVIDGIEKPNGKYPSALGNVAILEAEYIHDLVDQAIQNLRASNFIPNPDPLKAILPFLDPAQREQLEPIIEILENITTVIDDFQNNFDINHYALNIVVMYRDRFQTYIKALNEMNSDLIVFTNEISDAIDYRYPATFTLPLQVTLTPLYFLRLFLDQIFLFVAIVLIALGALLIYSLLLSNVEEKTYEYGMLRALGMKQYVLIELLIVQSLSFSVPGILVGLLGCFLLYIPIGYLISDFIAMTPDISLSVRAAMYGVVLGLIMPMIAIISPIQRALSRTLRDALDIYHQVQSEVTVRVIKLEKLGLSPLQTTASILMIIMGFVVYYLIPYSFTFQNLPLFFIILTVILIGMLLGLSLIGQTLQPYLERFGVFLIVWGTDRRTVGPLVKKNLSAHSRRNLKTSIMFTTSLAFIIFLGVSFTLQGNTIANVARLASGGDLLVLAPFSGENPLNEDGMREYLLRDMNKSNTFVQDFTFVTPALNTFDFIDRIYISSLAGYPRFRAEVYGLEKNFLDSTYSQFYITTEVSNQFEYNKTAEGRDDAVESLYVNAGQATLPQEEGGINIPPDITSYRATRNSTNYNHDRAYINYVDVIISESLRLSGSIDVDTPLMLTVRYKTRADSSSSIVYLCKVRAMISKMPGFFFSSYRQTANFSPVLITMDQFYRILNETYHGPNVIEERTQALPDKPPKQKLQVKLRSDLTKPEREVVMNGIRTFIDNDVTQIVSAVDLVNSTDVALELLTVFFNIVAIIAISLCFFVLWLSFTANVNENAWEFGVLRAIGLNSATVIRMYIYEALSLIFSSVLIGSVVGILVAVTLTLQFNLFSEFAFTFAFPYALFFSVLGMAVLVAIFGSYLPSYSLKKKDIAIALKNM